MCLDLNTLQLVWVQDTLDDSNSTPVLEIEKGHLYLYVRDVYKRQGLMNCLALESACFETSGKESVPSSSLICERFWNMEAFEEKNR